MSDSSERRTTFSVSKALSGMSPKKSGFRATDLETGFAGLLGLYTLMQSLGMGGEERA